MLLPYADRCPVGGAVVCAGSASRQLGLLATTLSRFEDAEKHFEAALERNARIRARIWVAHTQHDYARMLWVRGSDGDREKAAKLLRKAVASRVQDAITRIRREHAVLALHFANSIRMGTFCSYAPERPLDWRL